MATVRRVEVAREASGIAVGADIHVLADGAVESRPYDFLHAAGATISLRVARGGP